MKLLDYINEQTNNAYKDFKLVSVIFDEKVREITFKFLYKDILKENDKNILTKLILDYLNVDIKVIVKCKKAYVDEDLVRDVIYNFISRNYASVGVNFCKQDILVNISNQIEVIINCNDFAYNYLNSNNIIKELNDYGESFFFEPFMLSLNNVKPQIIENNDEYENSFLSNIYYDNSKKLKTINVTNIQNVVGEVNGSPIEISGITSPMENVEIAGKIRFFNQKSFESKRKDKEGNSLERIYFSFVLFDKTSKINCVVFPNKADLPKMYNFKDDDYVVLHGAVEEFNGRFSFKVDSIATAEFVDDSQKEEEVIEIKSEPNKEYRFARPEEYYDLKQDNFFAQSDEIGQYLLDNDVVVFDIETTGLEVSRCEIIEIGAIKLHKGKKVETFETFVKPQGEIPEEITELTGITYDMVKSAAPIEYIIADFYKFCYGCTIMAYNIDFDYKFINQFGKKNGWIFDNKQIDVLYLARAFVPGLKNFKLSTVCKKLDISLENAHRAVHDAMATADVVIKLSPNIT